MVFFAFDSAELTTQSMSSLNRFVTTAKTTSGGGRVFVCGYADNAGSPEANLTISQARAEAVRQALIRLGLAGETIVVRGFGDKQPLVPTPAGTREPQNRRVEVNFEHPLGLGGQSCRLG
jgi:OmpA-OmpF porin, OOP family